MGEEGGDDYRAPPPLFLAKSFCFLDGEEQLLFQLFEAFVGRQVQTVKTTKHQEGGEKCRCKSCAVSHLITYFPRDTPTVGVRFENFNVTHHSRVL